MPLFKPFRPRNFFFCLEIGHIQIAAYSVLCRPALLSQTGTMSHQIQYFFVPQGDNGNNRRRRVINSHATRHVRRQKRKATIDSALVPKKTLGSYTECNTLSGPCEFDEIRTDLRSVRHDDFALRVQQPAWHTRTLDEQELLVNLNKFCESSKERISKKAQKWLDTLKLYVYQQSAGMGEN